MASSLEQFFGNNLHAAGLFAVLDQLLIELGPYALEVKKTSIHVVGEGASFLGISKRVNGLRLTIPLDRALVGPRIVKCDQTSKRRFHNEVMLTHEPELDSELRG